MLSQGGGKQPVLFTVGAAATDIKTRRQGRWRKGQRDSQGRVQSQVPKCQLWDLSSFIPPKPLRAHLYMVRVFFQGVVDIALN